jgi:hypothetical protein
LPSNVENLILADGDQRGSGNGLNNIITSTLGHSSLNALAGNDILIAGGGFNSLAGGAGSDMFVFVDSVGGNRITDFRDGEDLIDMQHVIDDAGYTGTDPVTDHVIAITSNGSGGAIISVDLNGTMRPLVEVQGVAPSALQLGSDVLWA